MLLHRLRHPVAEGIVGERRASHADDPESFGQALLGFEPVQRWHELPGGQVAGGPDDDECEGSVHDESSTVMGLPSLYNEDGMVGESLGSPTSTLGLLP